MGARMVMQLFGGSDQGGERERERLVAAAAAGS